eukprot:COSAG06_NODE_7481_length_2490_cov_21.558762_1_plen_62_part_10
MVYNRAQSSRSTLLIHLHTIESHTKPYFRGSSAKRASHVGQEGVCGTGLTVSGNVSGNRQAS